MTLDEDHGLDDARPHPVRLGLGAGHYIWSTVGRHHFHLTTNGQQYPPVAVDEDQKDDDIEGQEIPEIVVLSAEVVDGRAC